MLAVNIITISLFESISALVNTDIKNLVLGLAFLLGGIGWNTFWKTIDYMYREKLVSMGVKGQVLETLIDLLHHTKTFAIVFALAFYYLYGTVLGTIIMSFALGNIILDLKKEKARILEFWYKMVSELPKSEVSQDAVKLLEGIISGELLKGEEEEEEEKEVSDTLEEKAENIVDELLKEAEKELQKRKEGEAKVNATVESPAEAKLG